MEKHLYRSRSDRMISGVCGGIAEYFGVDPVVVRLAAVLAALLTSGGAIVAYLVMAIVVPEGPESGAAAAAPSAVPAAARVASEEEVAMTEQDMGPGDMPEPGEYGAPGGAHPAPPQPAQWTAPAPSASPPAPVRHGGRGGITAGIVLIVIGGLFLANNFVPGFDLWRLWPVILIAVGLSIMIRRGRD